MLQSIGKKENVPAFIEAVKAKKTRLMGFGHRFVDVSLLFLGIVLPSF
jgi:citrate synthase